MAQQNLTIWQRLGNIFRDPKPQLKQTTQYNFDTRELLKTQSREEFELEKLQKQQSLYLHNQWQKVDSELYQQAIFYETTRIAAYTDFESMEFYPELSAALDIMMEESCLYSGTEIPLLNGKTETIEDLYKNNITNFWVYSVDIKNNKIKPSMVERVIHKGVKDTYKLTLDDETEIICTDNHLWLNYDNEWVETKNLKVGDYFWCEPDSIMDNHRIVNIEYYGKENVYDLVNSSVDNNFAVSCEKGMIISHNCTVDQKGKILNIYSESERVKKELENLFYNNLNIHTSLPMWTRNTPIREDSIIPLIDGTEITIKELSNRIKNGEEIWSYAIQDGTKAIVPSKIIWCDLTRKNSELYRVTLDDNTYIDTTPDHEYMLRDGSFIRADKLTKGQSLMPFYTRKSEKKQDRIVGYEKVFNPSTGKYKFTHSMVSHECIRDLEKERLIGEQFDTHHADFNKLNNHPNNLKRLTHSEHFKLHAEHFNKILGSPEVRIKRMEGIDRYLRSDKRRKRLSKEMKGIYPKYFKEYNNSYLHLEHNKIRSEKMSSHWGNGEFVEKIKNKMTITINDKCFDYISNIIKNSDFYIGINALPKLLKNDEKFIELFKETYTLRKDIRKSINTTTLNKIIKRKTNGNYFDYVFSVKPEIVLDKSYLKAKAIFEGKTRIINHKVISVIKLEEKSDVYCLEAVGPNGEHDRHNFPVCGKDKNGNHSRTSGVFLSNCKYGDNFIFLNIDEVEGVKSAKQLPNIEIERWETDLYSAMNRQVSDDPKPQDIKFIWKSKEYEFKSWQIAHFRLLTDDRRLPYGVSMLEKARRIYKQLMLAEDAMLIYRVTRAPERRVFKIFVGNLDDKDIEPYVNQVANKFKRTPLIDSKTGQMDLRYNQIAQDQDFFIPVRDINAPNPIDTLAGAQNLSEIQDIEYLQKKMFTAIRVPKTFLGFEEAVGEGKNLALQDIRFARTINRIQQAMLQELNKIAIIHLYVLGLDDELENFTLTLNNPSTQAEMLKIEHTQQKITLYKDCVADAGNGFAPMSMTKAKKEILNMSDDEIRLDLEQQRIEKAAAAELANTAEVIKSSGIFNKVDKIYGEIGKKSTGEGAPETGGAEPMGGGGVPTPPEEPAGGEAGGAPPAVTPESFLSDNQNLLTEDLIRKDREKKEKYKKVYYDRLLEYYEPKDTLSDKLEIKIEETENKISNKIQNILSNIDDIIDE